MKGEWSADRSKFHWCHAGHRFTIFKRGALPCWYCDFIVKGRRINKRSLHTTEKDVACKKVEALWQWELGREMRPPEPVKVEVKTFANLEEILLCYERKIVTVSERPLKPAVIVRNVAQARNLVAWARGSGGKRCVEADLRAVKTSALDAKFLDAAGSNYFAPVPPDDEEARDRRRRGFASMVRQARSVFKGEALRLYRAEGLAVPDLREFLRERKVSAPLANHRSIEPGTMRAMHDAAAALQGSEPQLWLAHLALKFLGLRPIDLMGAVVGCFQLGEWGQWCCAIVTRGAYRPKGSQGVVPVTQAVMRLFAAALGDRLALGDEALMVSPLIDLPSRERHDLIYRRHSEFMRAFLPRELYQDSSYELRRWGIQTMRTRYGESAAEAFARHAKKTVTQRHYLERYFPWRTLGDDVGIRVADVLGDELAEGQRPATVNGMAALRALATA